MSDEAMYSFAALHNRLRITGNLVAQTAIRIGAGRATDVVSNDLPVLRDMFGAPFIPGASLKGSLRARAEALIRTVAPTEARDLFETEDHQRGKIQDIKEKYQRSQVQGLDGKELQEIDKKLSQDIWAESTMIDLTFGAPWVAGRLFMKDALVDRSLWFDESQFEVRNGVALNRDTETSEDGFLYDYEVVPAGMRFAFELVLENAEPWQLGMVLLLLLPWERGDAQIGGFRTRGLGYVKLEKVQRHFVRVDSVDSIVALLDGSNESKDNVSEENSKTWVGAFKAELINRIPNRAATAD